jgi:FkbM family methyltransferase
MEYMYNTEIARDEFAISGEDWLLNKLKTTSINTIFDVGANQGEWTRMANEVFPSADIHAFEIIPEVYRKFINNGLLNPKITPNGFGLAEKIGTTCMKYCADNDRLSTYLEMLSPGTIENMSFQWRECIVVTGDAYMKQHQIEFVDFLKIDVEGGEHLVMKGFTEALAVGKVGCIQFEYGTANIVARWLLVDMYELLTPLGYELGRLCPNSVEFKPYELTDEDFYGPNFVAVHASRSDILAALELNNA